MERPTSIALGTESGAEDTLHRQSDPPLERRSTRQPAQQSHPLLAIDALQKEFPEHTAYFPAYEIMMDELREYRSMPTICCIHPPRRSNISGNDSQAACFHLIRCQFLKNGRISKRPLTTSRFNRKAKPINDSSRKLC